MNILPIPARIECVLSLENKVLDKLVINKNKKYKKQFERDQQTNKPFDKLYSKSLQDNVSDKTEYESLGKSFTRYADETKIESIL